MSIVLEKVTKVYRSGEVETKALKEVSINFQEGEIVAILGPSGSGKSTLLNVCSGLDVPTDGKIQIDEDIISEMSTKELTRFRRDNLGFIFQQHNLLQTLSVRENVEVGRAVSNDPFETEEIIDRVGLTPNIDKYPYQISGGEAQRVSIARAVVKNPKILFCDEPTGALDEDTAKEILTVLENLNAEYKTTICLITHNPNIAKMADRIVKLNSGEVIDSFENADKHKAKHISWS
ncbi:MAG: ABC transporter ATP-binding protein [Candidatus Izemoplasma sp.]|nr:ABC transporter ATP-binding protein [Candidatus Izemoplasma sp.]